MNVGSTGQINVCAYYCVTVILLDSHIIILGAWQATDRDDVNILPLANKSVISNAANKYFTNIVTDVTHDEVSQDIIIENDTMKHDMQMFKKIDEGSGEMAQQL